MTIRKRLLWVLGSILTLLLGLSSVGAYLASRHEIDEVFDAQLATSARVLHTVLDRALVERPLMAEAIDLESHLGTPQPTPTLSWLDFGQATELGHKYEKKLAFQVWSKEGWLLAHSPTAPQSAMAPLRPGYSFTRYNSHEWRVFSLDTGQHIYQVADRDDMRGELANYIAGQIAAVVVVALPLLMVVISFVVVRALRPLEQLAGELRSRGPNALAPLQSRGQAGELKAISHAINGLFERLERAFVRERQFAGNAAHELRTPLAALSIHAENAADARTDEERRASLEQMQEGLARTTRVVEQLLALSRVEPMVAAGQWQSVDLRQAAHQIAAEVAMSHDRDLDSVMVSDGQESLIIRGNPALLLTVLRNLIDNALRYGPETAPVAVNLMRDGGWVVLEVCDQGPGIPENQRQKVFEPFVRGEGHSKPGSGLGLAIVREIVELHHGRITLRDNTTGGLCFAIRFPAV